MFHSLVDTINLHKPAYVQSTDPSILTGFQGAGVGWIDTSLGSGSWAFKIRNNANTGWEVISGGGGGITSIGNTTPTTLNSIIYGNDTVTGNVSIGAGLEFIGGVLSSTVSGGYSTLYGGNDITITGASGDETISFTNTTGYITESALSTLQGALIAGSGISISGDTISSTIVGGITTLYGGTDISITGTDTINFTGTIPTLIGGNDITVISAGGYDTISFINSTGYSTITPVQSDWNETLTSALDYIKNKPSIPTQGLTSLVGGAGITINNSGNTDTISFNNPGYITEITSSTPTNLTSGSLLYSNGSDISQDNSNLYWDDSGSTLPSGTMQIGARETNPQDATFEVYGNAGNIAHFHYTGAAGATGGAIVDFSAMSGSALISGSRLGSMQFAGSYDTSLIPGIGAAINGVTTQDWSSNNLGSQLVFSTVPNNSTTRTTALILDQNQQAMFSAYTTNGFVKFTAGNGTLGVDTNSYLSTLYAGNGISITGGDTISANLVAGANVTITSGTGGDTISAASSSGITQLYAGTGISITGTDTISTNLIAGTNITIQSGLGGDTITASGGSLGYTALNAADNLSDMVIAQTTVVPTYNLTGASYASLDYTESQDASIYDITLLQNDNTKLYTLGVNNKSVYQYTLGTPGNISTASYVRSFSVSAKVTGTVGGLTFSPDGSHMFVTDQSNNNVIHYSLSTPGNISTASYVETFSTAAHTTICTQVKFGNNGNTMYIGDYTNKAIYEYTLTIAYTLSTASYTTSFSVSSQISAAFSGFNLDPTGTILFAMGAGTRIVYQYTLGTAWNI
jgi:hypothetical protein